MTNIRAQVILHTTDSLAANYVTNSWCLISSTLPGDSDYADYTAALKDFYDDLGSMLAIPIAQNGHEVKYYDLDFTTPPNYPLFMDTFNLTSAPNQAGLPSEVCLCLSFQGQKVPGFPQNRRRGRVYIGPCGAVRNASGRPDSTGRTALADAAETLCAGLAGSSVPALLGVWSQVDQAAVEVTDGWVDDAWDTQRRRGLQVTARTTWVP